MVQGQKSKLPHTLLKGIELILLYKLLTQRALAAL
jgi:hypothetical protein